MGNIRFVAVAVALSIAGAAGAAPKRAKALTDGPRFSAEVGIQVDGQEEVQSVTALSEKLTPILLPPSLWTCFTRETTFSEHKIAGLAEPVQMYGKEIVCSIHNTETKETLTQIGTAAMCVRGDSPRDAYFYIREGKRLMRLMLRCSFE